MAYAALGRAVGLSGGAAHDRVRKLRERGVIRRTTIEVDPVALGRGVLAFVLVDGNAWMGARPRRSRPSPRCRRLTSSRGPRLCW
jgi:Lrp/AsnC family leucine-responsive transcriptional regulator